VYIALVTRLLFGFAVCSTAASALTVLYVADTSARWAELRHIAELAWLGGSPWRWVLAAALGAVALSAGSFALERRLAQRAERLSLSLGRHEPGKVSELVALVHKRVVQTLAGDTPNVVVAFDEIMRGAVSTGASDVHLSPTPEGLRITYRIMGELYEAAHLELRWCQPFSTRIKVLARLETHVSQRSQDGRLVMTLDGGTLEARVSTLPTETGERVVLRIVRGSRSVPGLLSLGFSEATGQGLVDLLSRPQGLLFVTGPVGSGKTTTLYAALKHLVDSRGRTTSVVTLEDPIELELPFATQTQIHTRAGRTFASTLRSVLRQDPNVLMVGEIRDQETAEIATQAGLTGHLILTTIHADGAAGPFARLMDMNVEPFAVASATLGCLSQRLLRSLCTACRREQEPEAAIRERFERCGVPLPPGTYYTPVGCEYCEGLGFAGRTPIAELLAMDAELRQAVTQRRTTAEILELARRQAFVPLLEDGLARARRGETSLAEVLRVAG
jgi:general secretion pathway protein E